MSLVGVIDDFADPGSPYTVTRYGTGSYVTGRYVPDSAPTTFTIVATIQPVSARDLKSLATGQHAEETRIVYTVTPLRTRTPTNAPDVVTYKSEPWTVLRVETWEAFGESWNRVTIARKVTP